MAQSMWNPSWTDEAKIAHRESIAGVGPMLIGFTPTPFWDAWNERREPSSRATSRARAMHLTETGGT